MDAHTPEDAAVSKMAVGPTLGGAHTGVMLDRTVGIEVRWRQEKSVDWLLALSLALN